MNPYANNTNGTAKVMNPYGTAKTSNAMNPYGTAKVSNPYGSASVIQGPPKQMKPYRAKDTAFSVPGPPTVRNPYHSDGTARVPNPYGSASVIPGPPSVPNPFHPDGTAKVSNPYGSASTPAVRAKPVHAMGVSPRRVHGHAPIMGTHTVTSSAGPTFASTAFNAHQPVNIHHHHGNRMGMASRYQQRNYVEVDDCCVLL